MKSIKFLTAVLVVTVVMISCKSKTPQELIVNKWQMTNISGGDSNQMPDSAKESMKKAVMEFTSDGKFHMTGTESPYEGSYAISSDGKLLTMTPTTGDKAEVDSVNTLTADKMVITDPSGTKLECAVKK
jgi:uncharacterized protein (TIGR03066 family)